VFRHSSAPRPLPHRPVRLRLSPKLSARTRRIIKDALARIPELTGPEISLAFSPRLSAHRGKLLSGIPHKGSEVHAATFIRQRRIVLDEALIANAFNLRLILIHELFHFVWVRLSNTSRNEFASLLIKELEQGARGELGESAGLKKAALHGLRCPDLRSRRWRDYVCESFCDTAAWLYSGEEHHPELKLAKRWRNSRRSWFPPLFAKTRRL
jgi:hypothetical protein